MTGKKSGLGRGLDALFPEKTVQSKPKTTVKTAKQTKTATLETNKSSQHENSNGERMMKLSMIEPNREQPRKKFDEDALQELADSIKQYGVLQPLLVSDKKDYYEIVAGERRWRAAKLAGLKEVPVVVRELSTQEIVEISLIENIQREDLNPVEEAMAYKRLIDELNQKTEAAEEELLEIPKQIKAENSTLMLLSMEYFYSKIRVNQEEAQEIDAWIKQVRVDLKKNIIKKQNREINNREIYNYLHDILGPEVLDLFDLQYDNQSSKEQQEG